MVEQGSDSIFFPLNNQKIELTEITQNEDFKKNICIPYFKDIYKVIMTVIAIQDLSSRSDDRQKGINKISLLEVTLKLSANL